MSAIAVTTDAPEETLFRHSVVVVCESPNAPVARDAIVLNIETTSSPAASTSVLFTFSINTTDKAPCLHIIPDLISSLTRTVHDHTQLLSSPPCMDIVRQKLGITRNLTRLHFRLRSYGRLINSAGGGVPSDALHSDTADAILLLASTLVFSVYMPHDALQKAKYNIFYRAVRPFLDPTTAPQQRLEPPPIARQDDCRIHNQQGVTSSPPAYVDENERRTPQPIESDNDTVAVSTPSGFGPPDNDDDDDELPGYPDDESGHFALTVKGHVRKRHSRSSSEGSSYLRGTSKRGRWLLDPEAFIETESPSPSADLNHPDSRLSAIEARMQLQDQRIQKLEAENKQYRIRNEELECRVSELETRVEQLGEQHDQMEETLANVDVQYSELDADCSRVGQELAEIRDMSRDAIIDDINDKVQESIGEMVVMYREELKTKLIRVLQEV